MAASFSSSSSSFTSTYLSDAAAAKSLTASMAAAAAERGARRISSILSSADEEPRRNKGKRKMSPFFDKAAPIETAVSTHLSLLFAAPPTFKHTKNAIGPSLSPSLARSSYVFTSAGKPVDEIVSNEAGVSTHLSLLFAGPPTFKKTKNAIGPSPNMARSSDVFTSEGKPTDEIASTEAGVSTHLSLHFAGPPTLEQTKNAIGPSPSPSPSPSMARSSFPSSPTLSDAQFDEGKGKMPQFFDFFASEGKIEQTKNAIVPSPSPSPNMAQSSFPSSPTLFDARFDKGKGKMPQFFDFFASEGELDVDTKTLPTAENGVSTHLSLLHFTGTPKKTAVVSTRYSPPAPRGVLVVPWNLPALREDRWDIKKVLTKSDVDESSRLLLAKVVVQEHILPHVMGNGPGPDEGQGVEVAVWDMDKGSEHVLVLKKWKSGSFVLVKNWMSDFVRRRGLEKDDVIGLRWDDGNSRLEFTVLKKN